MALAGLHWLHPRQWLGGRWLGLSAQCRQVCPEIAQESNLGHCQGARLTALPEQVDRAELVVRRADAGEALLDNAHEGPAVVRARRDVRELSQEHVRAVEHLGKVAGNKVERCGRADAEQQRGDVVEIERDVVRVEVSTWCLLLYDARSAVLQRGVAQHRVAQHLSVPPALAARMKVKKHPVASVPRGRDHEEQTRKLPSSSKMEEAEDLPLTIAEEAP